VRHGAIWREYGDAKFALQLALQKRKRAAAVRHDCKAKWARSLLPAPSFAKVKKSKRKKHQTRLGAEVQNQPDNDSARHSLEYELAQYDFRRVVYYKCAGRQARPNR